MIRIKNDELAVEITPVGVELASVTDRESQREYIWQADPQVWGSHAPVLFPIIGGLKDGTYKFKGKSYELAKHGFIRRNPGLSITQQSEEAVTFSLGSNEELKQQYPFDFEFFITYQLEGRVLRQEHLVKNLGDDAMYFSLGGHPAFKVPHHPGERYEDHYLRFELAEDSRSNMVNTEGLIGPDTRSVPWTDNRLPLTHDLFAHDALVFKDLNSRKVTLMSEDSGQLVSVRFPDFNYLGIWAKPNGDFVCIEPWLGVADRHDTDGELTTKEGIIELAGGEEFSAAFSMEFH